MRNVHKPSNSLSKSLYSLLCVWVGPRDSPYSSYCLLFDSSLRTANAVAISLDWKLKYISMFEIYFTMVATGNMKKKKHVKSIQSTPKLCFKGAINLPTFLQSYKRYDNGTYLCCHLDNRALNYSRKGPRSSDIFIQIYTKSPQGSPLFHYDLLIGRGRLDSLQWGRGSGCFPSVFQIFMDEIKANAIFLYLQLFNYGESDGNNIFNHWGTKRWVWGFSKRVLLKKTA